MSKTLVFADDVPRSTISDRVRRGELRQLHRGVYTTDLTTPAERIIRDEWQQIVARLIPNATISDRSAITGGPNNGVLYLVRDGRPQNIHLPGLDVAARRGAPPLDTDLRLPTGLHLASRPRALAENAQPTRSIGGRPSRTLTRPELDTWIDRIAQTDGRERLADYRTNAEQLAEKVGTKPEHLAHVSDTIGAILGSRTSATKSAALAARLVGTPVDQGRIGVFQILASALRSAAPQSHPATTIPQPLAFFEAYFSNYIEGTEFGVDEARSIIDSGEAPTLRHEDGHDLLGTHQAIMQSNRDARPHSTDEWIERLQRQHQLVMTAHPDRAPGQFKSMLNQAGNTTFVAPELVEGTLRSGLGLIDQLDTAWERSVLIMFVVAEVHPFVDGNGRIARLAMNHELTAGSQQRTIIPTSLRDDYLAGLRRLSRHDDPELLIKTLRFAHDYTAAVDWTTFEAAEADLTESFAFEADPTYGNRLTLPKYR